MALIILIVGILQAAVVGVVIFLRARAVNAGRESVYANVLAEVLKILQRKEEDLKSKNDHLRIQIAETTSKMETIMSEIEMSAQMQEQVLKLRGDLLQSEEQGQTLLNEIQRGNEQYFILKRRYDALDVEYAQLYQQFNEGQH